MLFRSVSPLNIWVLFYLYKHVNIKVLLFYLIQADVTSLEEIWGNFCGTAVWEPLQSIVCKTVTLSIWLYGGVHSLANSSLPPFEGHVMICWVGRSEGWIVFYYLQASSGETGYVSKQYFWLLSVWELVYKIALEQMSFWIHQPHNLDQKKGEHFMLNIRCKGKLSCLSYPEVKCTANWIKIDFFSTYSQVL